MQTLTTQQRNHIAKVIKCKRKEFFGYSGGNRDLAEKIGVAPQLLSMWASNKRTPNQQELLKLSEVFDMDLDDLCRLKKRIKYPARGRKNPVPITVDSEKVLESMLKICDITSDLVDRQRQMLHGELSVKEHKNLLTRLKKCVDTI